MNNLNPIEQPVYAITSIENNDDNDVVFDRDPQDITEPIYTPAVDGIDPVNSDIEDSDRVLVQQNRALIQQILQSEELDPLPIREAKQRLRTKLLQLDEIRTGIANLQPNVVSTNVSTFDADMLLLGKLEGRFLHVEVLPFSFTVDMQMLIKNAFLDKKFEVIWLLLDSDLDLPQLEPKLMLMCLALDQDELLIKLIQLQFPIDTESYRVVYESAEMGKLDILKLIMATYVFDDIQEVICKICIQAAIHNHLSIIEHFFPHNQFESIPDIVFVFFTNSIKCGGHLDIIKYFVNGGVDIRQQNYLGLHIAITHNRTAVVKYFYDLDRSILDLMTEEEKQTFGLVELTVVNQSIGLTTSCNIYYNDIGPNEFFYQCTNKLHHYCKEAWDRWVLKRPNWICPHCQCSVPKILYMNTN